MGGLQAEQTVFLLKMGSQLDEGNVVLLKLHRKSSLLELFKKLILRVPAHPLLLSRGILTFLSSCREIELEFFVQAHVEEDCHFNEIIRKAKAFQITILTY